MKNKFLVLIIAGLLVTSFSFCQTVVPQLNNGFYSLQVGNVYFEVDPSFGARISSLKLDNSEIMFVDRSNGSYLWGSTFWQSPQSDWNWPPSVNLDQNAYDGGISNNKIILLSQVDGNYHTNLQFRKTFYADLADTSITVIYTMINTGSSAHKYSPWELTRVPAGGMFFFPIGDGSLSGAFASQFEDFNGIEFFKYTGDEPASQKMFGDGAEGWTAFVNDDRAIMIKKFSDVPSDKQATGEKEVELWYNGPGSYLELETQGEYKNINANDSLVWTVKWLVRKVPSGISLDKGSSDLVAYVRKVVQYTPVNISNEISQLITVFPNPSNGYMTIRGIKESTHLTVFDITGKIVLQSNVNKNNATISLSNLKDGLYVYKLSNSTLNFTGKFLLKK
jgi:hypothetical protein